MVAPLEPDRVYAQLFVEQFSSGPPAWAAALPACGITPCPARLELLSVAEPLRDALTAALEVRSD